MTDNKLEKVNTVIFDLDGTLLDTLEDLKDALNYALTKHGMPCRSLAEVRCFVGNGAKELLKRAVEGGEDNLEFEAALSDFKSYYKEHSLVKTAPYNGVIDVMRRLKECGYRLAIVSNKPDAAVKDLDRHFFAGLTEVAIGESDRIAKKPAPDMVNEALEIMKSKVADITDVDAAIGGTAEAEGMEIGGSADFKCDPINAVYVGDSEVDLMTASNSKLPCISVTWGFRDKEFLVERGANIFVDRPEELLELLG